MSIGNGICLCNGFEQELLLCARLGFVYKGFRV